MVKVPICLDAKYSNKQWTKFLTSKLRPYCHNEGLINEHLAEFTDSKEDISEFQKDDKFVKHIRDYIRRYMKSFGGGVGNWHRGESIWMFALDGLHCGLRIASHTIKYFILFSIEYNEFIWQEENTSIRMANHRNAMEYTHLNQTQILNHFRDCCQIKFHYDEQNPGNTKIYSGLPRKHILNLLI